MNKIFKVVWSKVKNCYVVVSEIAKNVITGSVKSAKIGSAPMVRGAALGAMMAFVITGQVWAQSVYLGTGGILNGWLGQKVETADEPSEIDGLKGINTIDSETGTVTIGGVAIGNGEIAGISLDDIRAGAEVGNDINGISTAIIKD